MLITHATKNTQTRANNPFTFFSKYLTAAVLFINVRTVESTFNAMIISHANYSGKPEFITYMLKCSKKVCNQYT